jgi:endonuclease-3
LSGTKNIYHSSGIQHPASSIKHQASSIQHPASSIKQPASSIKHQASSIKHPETFQKGSHIMKTKKQARNICEILRMRYPNVKTQLDHRNAFELLMATILSAQCTDKQVNAVTQNLFEHLSTPEDFATAQIETIEDLIRPTGYFHNKAKHLKNCSKMLIEKYKGAVPKTLDELLKLPGVGRKTANVVLGAVFGVPGMVVDTHVKRISRRLGLTANTDPVKIEFDLMKIIPKADWNDFSLWLIYLGRERCKARKPDCSACPLYQHCDSPDKTA